jgi:hypothetical protein
MKHKLITQNDIVKLINHYKTINNYFLYEKYKKYIIFTTCNLLIKTYADDTINGKNTENNIFLNKYDAHFSLFYYYNSINDNETALLNLFNSSLNDDSCYIISMYFENIKNYDKMYNYLIKSCSSNNLLAISKLISIYLKNKINVNENEFYNIVNNLNVNDYNYFEMDENDYDKLIFLYKLKTNENNKIILMKIINLYEKKQFYKQLIKYCKIYVNKFDDDECKNIYYKIALFYKNKNINNYFINLKKAIKLNNYDALDELENYYITTSNSKKLVKLYDNINLNFNTDIYELFCCLTKVNEKYLCPITLKKYNTGLKCKCEHIFSYDILFIKSHVCPLCRTKIM